MVRVYPLLKYDMHQQLGARFIDFAGWHMPLHYGSQISEHMAVRQGCGVFDVSHMGVFDIQGRQAHAFLQYLLANDVARTRPGQEALYSCLLNEAGGVLDDLMVYRLGDTGYRCIVNAGNQDQDWLHVQAQAAAFDLILKRRHDLAIIATQGPGVRALAAQLLPSHFTEALCHLKPFQCAQVDDMTLACTGYTGEDGFEWVLPHAVAQSLWHACMAQGMQPCGLGARDSLRLEMGYRLHGLDMHAGVTPLESGLGWTVAMRDQRDFIGKAALTRQKQAGLPSRLIGVQLQAKGMLHAGDGVESTAGPCGEITSAAYSPLLRRCVAMARVQEEATGELCVKKRGKKYDLSVVDLPFIASNASQHKESI